MPLTLYHIIHSNIILRAISLNHISLLLIVYAPRIISKSLPNKTLSHLIPCIFYLLYVLGPPLTKNGLKPFLDYSSHEDLYLMNLLL